MDVLSSGENQGKQPTFELLKKEHYRSGGLIVWAGMVVDERTTLTVFGTLYESCRNDSLVPYALFFINAAGIDFILIEYNKWSSSGRQVSKKGGYSLHEWVGQISKLKPYITHGTLMSIPRPTIQGTMVHTILIGVAASNAFFILKY